MEFERSKKPSFTICFRRHSINQGDELKPEGIALAFNEGKKEGKRIDEIGKRIGVDYIPVRYKFSKTKRTEKSARHHLAGVCETSNKAVSMTRTEGSQKVDERINTFSREGIEKQKATPLDNSELNEVFARWVKADERLDEVAKAGFEHRGLVQRRFNEVLSEGLKTAKQFEANSGYGRAYYFSHSGMPSEGSERGVLDAVFEMLSGEKIGVKSDLQLLQQAKNKTRTREIPSFKHLEGFDVHFLKKNGKWTYVVEEVRH